VPRIVEAKFICDEIEIDYRGVIAVGKTPFEGAQF
jgi:hypothetical protein